ncbi:zinc ribbon domain-containing protein [Micromonospora sp. NPDC006431]|uniref:zinc ribbon domain-containing protein n=1 Tax=Micromonospora sp. NPDC006431 TaxID=3364235 RepID=UPI0036B94CCA
MATYTYRCSQHGDFAVSFPIGEATARVPCSLCGSDGARVISAPLLIRTPRPLAAAIDRAAQSAERPDVVSSIPGRQQAGRRPANPLQARLPRP